MSTRLILSESLIRVQESSFNRTRVIFRSPCRLPKGKSATHRWSSGL